MNAGARPAPIRSLTTIRGYLACWVLLYHLSKELFLLFPDIAVIEPIITVGHLAVPGFFILSGYVLWINYAGWFRVFRPATAYRFLMLRMTRLYPVHLITLLATLAMVIGSSVVGISFPQELYSKLDFIRNLLLIQTWVPNFHFNWNYPSWSISSEWFAYLCFPVICLALHRITSSLVSGFGIVISASVMFAFVMQGGGVPFHEMIGVLPPFIMGCCIATLAAPLPEPNRTTYLPELIAVVVLLLPMFVESRALRGAEHLLLAGLVGLLGWAKSKSSAVWNNPIGHWLGEVSYSLYMCHFLVIKVANQVVPLESFATRSLVDRMVVLAVYLAAIFALSYGVYRCVEWPSQRYFKTKRSQPIGAV